MKNISLFKISIFFIKKLKMLPARDFYLENGEFEKISGNILKVS